MISSYPKILLVDVMGIIVRSHFGCYKNPIMMKNGIEGNGLYGLLSRIIDQIVSPSNYTFLGLATDSSEHIKRNEWYSQYKSHRGSILPEIQPQIDLLPMIASSLQIPLLFVPGYEADDILATLCKKISKEKKKFNTLIYSTNKGLMQLVSDDVHFINFQGKVFNVKSIEQLFGLSPNQLADYFSLVGNRNDNFFGVRGIGPSTAKKLLLKYHHLKYIYDNIEKISSDLRNKLIENKENAFLSYSLACLDHNIPLNISINSLKLPPIENISDSQSHFAHILFEYGFNNLFYRLKKGKISSEKNQNIFNQSMKDSTLEWDAYTG